MRRMMIGLFIASLASSALAYYMPGQGRWLSRDPMGEKAGNNAYRAFRNSPTEVIDPHGLWDASVHYVATRRLAMQRGYPDDAAELVGRADDAVDSGRTSPYPILGDQSYHFNRNLGGGKDSRIAHFERHLKEARRFCTMRPGVIPSLDWPQAAAIQLGTALHPFQDVDAHGDFGMRMDMIYAHHNMFSPQYDYGYPGYYPDYIWLDAVGSEDGTPSGRAIHVINNAGWDYAIFTFGNRRYAQTRKRTLAVMAEFRDYVKTYGGCNCRRFFGIEQAK